jgi:hypothetical protein
VAPSDAAVTRARVDLLRLQGDVDGARKLVGSISAGSSQPENALTLGALDLAEDKPSWPVAIERLRVATSGEQHLGRARALLVYALARSGDLAGARVEQERLASMTRPHPLAATLRVFIERQEGQPAGAKSASPATGAASASPGAASTPATRGPQKPGRPGGAEDGDDRVPEGFGVPTGTIDASDLPGHAPPAPSPTAAPGSTAAPRPTMTPAPGPASTTPSQVDTSDLPGFKHE